jgi:predicted Zn-dependent protease
MVALDIEALLWFSTNITGCLTKSNIRKMHKIMPDPIVSPINRTAPVSTEAKVSEGVDIIPLPVLVSIFAVVLGFVVFLMAPSWKIEWNRFRSVKALQSGDYKGAVDALIWLNNVEHNNPTFLSELGVAYLNLKRFDEAIQWLELAQKNRTNLPADDQGSAREAPDFNTYLGRAYLGKGDLTKAEQHLQAALKHDKLDHSANYHMGEIEMKRQNYVKAADHFKVVVRDPVFEPLVKKYYEEIEQKLFADVDQPAR